MDSGMSVVTSATKRATLCMLMGQLMRFRCVHAIILDFFSLVLPFSVFSLVDRDAMTLRLEYLEWKRRKMDNAASQCPGVHVLNVS